MSSDEAGSRERIILDGETKRRALNIGDAEDAAAFEASEVDSLQADTMASAESESISPDEAIVQVRHDGSSDRGAAARPGLAAHRAAGRTPHTPASVGRPRGPRR